MAKAARIAPNIRELLLNILITDCFRTGEPVEVPRGVQIRAVPVSRFQAHRELLEESALDDRQRVEAGKK